MKWNKQLIRERMAQFVRMLQAVCERDFAEKRKWWESAAATTKLLGKPAATGWAEEEPVACDERPGLEARAGELGDTEEVAAMGWAADCSGVVRRREGIEHELGFVGFDGGKWDRLGLSSAVRVDPRWWCCDWKLGRGKVAQLRLMQVMELIYELVIMDWLIEVGDREEKKGTRV